MPQLDDTSVIDDEEGLLAALAQNAAPALPLETRTIALEDIAELENGRDSYEGIEELAQTLHAEGLLHGLTVRPAAPDAAHGKPYELICGYRRKRAAELLRDEQQKQSGESEWTHVLCHVRPIGDRDVRLANLIENIGRDDMTALEVAQAIRRLKEVDGFSQAEIGRKLGMNKSEVSKRLTLLRQPEAVIERLQHGQLNASQVEELFSLESDEEKEELARRAVKFNWSSKELSNKVREFQQVKATDEAVTAEETSEPIGTVTVSTRVELPMLELRSDLDERNHARMVLWMLLRLGNDEALLEQIDKHCGFGYGQLWDYIRTLSDNEVEELTVIAARRGVTAPHRFHSLERSLEQDLGAQRRQRALRDRRAPAVPGPSQFEELSFVDMIEQGEV
jgi:ParB/RepB/Spo0J family partition protein